MKLKQSIGYLLAKSFVADIRTGLYASTYSNKNVDVFKARHTTTVIVYIPRGGEVEK